MGLFGKKKVDTACCCGNVDDLVRKEQQELKEQSCGCSSGGDCCKADQKQAEDNGLTIKILGSGCKNCVTLAENVTTALEEMKLSAEVTKVTDFTEITGYGVMSTPALVVNEKVVSYGKVLKTQEVVKILEKILG